MEKMRRKIDTALYRFDGKPSWAATFPQSLQHLLAMLVGNITPPILIASQLGLPEEEKIMLMQAAMLIAGISTLLQIYPIYSFGMGLPNVTAVGFAYMPILLSIGLSADTPQEGIATILGAQLVAAFVSIFIGFFIGKIRRFFPPIVSGTVVLSIGLSLYSSAITNMAGGSTQAAEFGALPYWLISAVVLVITLACSLFGKGYVKVSGMLIGMLVGYVLCLILSPLEPFSVLRIDFSSVGTSQIFALPRFLHFGLIFEPSAILSMIMMYIVQAVQNIGDVSSTAIGAFDREASDLEIGGSIKGQGICGMLGALIGGFPTAVYSQNVGLIVTTRVTARRIFTLVSGVLIVAGLFPVLGAALTTVPAPVIGGATITVFAAITMSGIQLITQQPFHYRNKMIVGVALALGVGVSSLSGSLQHFPAMIQNLFGSSPIVLSFLVAFVLNLIVPEEESASKTGDT